MTDQNKQSTALVLDAPEMALIETSKAEQIRGTFLPMSDMLATFEDRYAKVIKKSEGEITPLIIDEAKRLRLDIAKVRITTEKLRKEQKDEYLRAGKAIDSVSNILKWAVTDKENALKAIEDHYEAKERERLKALQEERVALLSPYVEDAEERVLCDMEDDVWDIYLDNKKKAHEDVIAAKEQAEKAAEAKIKDDQEAKEKLEAENAKLKADQEAAAAKQKAIDDEREAKAKAEAKIKTENDAKAKAETDAKIKAEQEKSAKLQAELDVKKKADDEAAAKTEALEQERLNNSDAVNKRDLLADLLALTTKYTFKSKKNQKMYEVMGNWLKIIIDRINKGEAK